MKWLRLNVHVQRNCELADRLDAELPAHLQHMSTRPQTQQSYSRQSQSEGADVTAAKLLSAYVPVQRDMQVRPERRERHGR